MTSAERTTATKTDPKLRWWRPRLHFRAAVPSSIEWTRNKKLALVIACMAGAGFLYRAITVQFEQPVLFTLGDLYWFYARLALIEVGFAAIVLVALRYIGGVPAAWRSKRRARQQFLHGFGYYLWLGFPLGITGAILELFIHGGHFSDLGNGADRPTYFVQLVCLAAASAFAEEVVATVFVYWLLERFTLRNGKTVASTFWGTTAVVVVHMSYHLRYGWDVLRMVPVLLVTVLCWRYARSIMALVLAHFLWDAISLLPAPMTAQLSFWSAAAIVGFLLDWWRGPQPKKRSDGAVV